MKKLLRIFLTIYNITIAVTRIHFAIWEVQSDNSKPVRVHFIAGKQISVRSQRKCKIYWYLWLWMLVPVTLKYLFSQLQNYLFKSVCFFEGYIIQIFFIFEEGKHIQISFYLQPLIWKLVSMPGYISFRYSYFNCSNLLLINEALHQISIEQFLQNQKSQNMKHYLQIFRNKTCLFRMVTIQKTLRRNEIMRLRFLQI